MTLDQLFAAQIVARQVASLLAQSTLFDDRLRGDPGMVGTGYPQRLESLHAMPTHLDVLQGVVQCVSEM
ncbi:MAG: hypothetical protein KatS3mg111_0206 [Pirellulaceae bacterium]|nr:MAG: hypothetical protein KatS3mg111_0206 [Pirellulaceae bacterium]